MPRSDLLFEVSKCLWVFDARRKGYREDQMPKPCAPGVGVSCQPCIDAAKDGAR